MLAVLISQFDMLVVVIIAVAVLLCCCCCRSCFILLLFLLKKKSKTEMILSVQGNKTFCFVSLNAKKVKNELLSNMD